MTQERAKQLQDFAHILKAQVSVLRDELNAEDRSISMDDPNKAFVGWAYVYMNSIEESFNSAAWSLSKVRQ